MIYITNSPVANPCSRGGLLNTSGFIYQVYPREHDGPIKWLRFVQLRRKESAGHLSRVNPSWRLSTAQALPLPQGMESWVGILR